MVTVNYSITIDARSGAAVYPWKPTPVFSPPETWAPNLVPERDPAHLSQFIPHDWANMDVTKVPMLVAPWSSECAVEIRDLFALQPMRDRFETRIYGEDQYRMPDFLGVFLELLRSAGANLQFQLGNGRTVEDHLTDLGGIAFGDAGCLVLNQKALFNRPRCYQISPGLLPMVLPGHASYPSGHSTQLHTLAWTMWQAFARTRYAQAADLFNDYATAVARRREIAGVHYSSDTVAGMSLAQVIIDKYLSQPLFRTTYLDPLRALP